MVVDTREVDPITIIAAIDVKFKSNLKSNKKQEKLRFLFNLLFNIHIRLVFFLNILFRKKFHHIHHTVFIINSYGCATTKIGSRMSSQHLFTIE